MSNKIQILSIVFVVLLLAACRSGDGSPKGAANVIPIDTGPEGVASNLEGFFAGNVQPALAFCRTCHLPGNIADTAEGRGFMLSSNAAEDFERMKASWTGLGKGVAVNPILVQNSESSAEHSGGIPWLKGSASYLAVSTLFACWNDPANCSFSAGGAVAQDLPLLGSAQGGHFWDDFCNGLVDADGVRKFSEGGDYLTVAQAIPRPDSTSLPLDPRDLVRAGVSDGKAVHFNAFWRDCHAYPDLVNEFPHPKNCGQFRASVARGSIIMGAKPVVDAAGMPYRYGTNEPYKTSEPSIYSAREGVKGKIIRNGTTFAGDSAHGVAALTAEQYNNLWMTWGLPSRPDNFNELVAERYGFGQPSAAFPYPVIDSAKGVDETATLTVSKGGTGSLPYGLLQTRLEDGTYSGEISTNCQGCHSAQIGDQFVVGAGGGMLDATVSSRDFAAFGSAAGVAIDRAGLAGRVRGTNNAQFSNITALSGIRTEQQFQDVMQNGTTGTGDTPAWWNVGRRPVKFVDAMFPGDAVRVDYALFTPLLTDKYNPSPYITQEYETWVNDHVQDGDHYIISRKAPKYPLPINKTLAKQGAILFHSKNLWSKDNVVAKPGGGNGSCASCHGAYSPRFINDPSFLADPRMEGIASNVVAIDIIGTDRVRFDTYNQGTNEANSNTDVGYPETAPDSPERRALTDEESKTFEDCRAQNLPGLQQDSSGAERPKGYTAPPLYGVWATAPYLHNGSVPSVDALLDSASRPAIWRRVSKPARADQKGQVVMGYDYDLARAYDQQKLGWKYEELECGGGDFIPALDCTPLQQNNLDFFLSEFYGGLLMGWNITNPPSLSNDDIEARKIYNTGMFSQSNSGHVFSDVLTAAERKAIIEYLKTL